MKKIATFLLIILCTINLFSEESSKEKIPKIDYKKLAFGENNTLEIMTWNIQKFPKKGSVTINYAKNTILAIDSDVIGLQEIEDKKAFQQLVKALNEADKMNNWKGFRADSDEWNMNLAYIYKANVIQKPDIFEIYNDADDKYGFDQIRY